MTEAKRYSEFHQTNDDFHDQYKTAASSDIFSFIKGNKAGHEFINMALPVSYSPNQMFNVKVSYF